MFGTEEVVRERENPYLKFTMKLFQSGDMAKCFVPQAFFTLPQRSSAAGDGKKGEGYTGRKKTYSGIKICLTNASVSAIISLLSGLVYSGRMRATSSVG